MLIKKIFVGCLKVDDKNVFGYRNSLRKLPILVIIKILHLIPTKPNIKVKQYIRLMNTGTREVVETLTVLTNPSIPREEVDFTTEVGLR